MNIKEIFEEISKQMLSDFQMTKNCFDHPGMKGNSAEETFREFLKKYLPKSLDISTGILVDSFGNKSKQLDVIISDSVKTPIFYVKNETRVIPVECVYAVIEVKSILNNNELKKAFKNMESVKKLKKAAYVPEEGPIKYFHKMYGKEWDIWPINYYVFAYDSIKLETLLKTINSTNKKQNIPLDSMIDCVCVINNGVICNQLEEGGLSALPDVGSKLRVVEGNNLLLFYGLISHYLNQTRLPYFNFSKYIDNIKFMITK